MAEVLKRMAGPKELTAASVVQYDPAVQAIIKQLVVHNKTAGAVNFTFGIGADAAGTRIFDALPIPANEVMVIDVWIVVEAADDVRAHASAAASLKFEMSGIEL